MYWGYLCNLQFQTDFRELHTKNTFLCATREIRFKHLHRQHP